MFSNTDSSFGWLTRSLHWLIAIMILALVALGWYLVEAGYYDPNYQRMLDWHQSLGVLVLVLVVLKFAWHVLSRPPHYLDSVGRPERWLAGTIRWLFYGLMLAIPITGYVIATSEDGPVKVFGLFTLPAVFGRNADLNEVALEIHYYTAYAIAALAALHGAGALKHHFVDRDRTLMRMLKGE
ncbi:MAG: cytochrome b [Gammaproteobacteria bacterium]